MILPELYIAPTGERGRGVYASIDIARDTVIEVSPVIVMSRAERKLLDQTLLHDYIFEWGPDKKDCCMALGYVPLYNHSYRSNCEYEMEMSDWSSDVCSSDLISIEAYTPRPLSPVGAMYSSGKIIRQFWAN